eukprot:jgi/Mesen1/587/ME000107S10827
MSASCSLLLTGLASQTTLLAREEGDKFVSHSSLQFRRFLSRSPASLRSDVYLTAALAAPSNFTECDRISEKHKLQTHSNSGLQFPRSKGGRYVRCLAGKPVQTLEGSDSADVVKTPQNVWQGLLPQPLKYSSNMADVDAQQLSDLWASTLDTRRDPGKVMKAMLHSYAFILVIDESAAALRGGVGQIIGVGRAVSDGAFVATICDVAVLPDYQRRGVGRKIVKRLVQEMKGKGPTGFAVFPPPSSRRFFWMLGFRADRKYRIMAYKGKIDTLTSAAVNQPIVSQQVEAYAKQRTRMR